MIEITPNIGIGSLKLGMSRKEVEELLGPSKSSYDPIEEYWWIDKKDKKFYKDQIVEERKDKNLALTDLVYEKDRLVIINIDGKSKKIGYDGHIIGVQREDFLQHLYKLDKDAYMSGEKCLFATLGLVVSRPGLRKDINYINICDMKFQKKRIEYEMFKKVSGAFAPQAGL